MWKELPTLFIYFFIPPHPPWRNPKPALSVYEGFLVGWVGGAAEGEGIGCFASPLAEMPEIE